MLWDHLYDLDLTLYSFIELNIVLMLFGLVKLLWQTSSIVLVNPIL